MSDLFISFVAQDKQIARDLANILQAKGMAATFIQFGLGDSLMGRIEKGFREAEHGILILSPAFFKKPWPRGEMDKIATFDQEFDGRTLLFPLWHEINQQDIARYSPTLARRIGGATEQGLDFFADEVREAVQPLDVQSKAPQAMLQQKMASPEMIEGNLYDVLTQYFNSSELTDLAWDMNIDYEEIAGETKSAKARNLITYCQRRGRLDQLIAVVQSRRSFIKVTV